MGLFKRKNGWEGGKESRGCLPKVNRNRQWKCELGWNNKVHFLISNSISAPELLTFLFEVGTVLFLIVLLCNDRTGGNDTIATVFAYQMSNLYCSFEAHRSICIRMQGCHCKSLFCV